MRCPRSWKAAVAMVLGSSLAGSVCGLGCIGKVANNFNPCGTIIDCDPAEYDLMMNTWPDWDLDPTCTIPGRCGGVFPYNTGGGTTQTTQQTQQTQTTQTTTGGTIFPFF